MTAVVENDILEIVSPGTTVHRTCTHMHQKCSVPVDAIDVLEGRQAQPQGNGGGMPHGAYGEKVLSMSLSGGLPQLKQFPGGFSRGGYHKILRR